MSKDCSFDKDLHGIQHPQPSADFRTQSLFCRRMICMLYIQCSWSRDFSEAKQHGIIGVVPIQLSRLSGTLFNIVNTTSPTTVISPRMTFGALKLVGSPLTPVIGKNTLPRIISIKRARPLQVVNEGHKLQAMETVCVSRRDTMISLTAGTLSGIAFFTAQPANGRVVKPETRRKIFEKLEKLREKAGVSKPKTETGKNSSPAAAPSGKATKLQSSSPSLNSIGNPVRPLAEATLP